MGVDTNGKIKGFVKHEEILDFVKQKWDRYAIDRVEKRINNVPISECKWTYKFNEHSEDNENWYSFYGYICFNYNNEQKGLFYVYSNLNHFENLEFYSKHNLRDMVETETTFISLRYCGNSVEIMKEIIKHFGGGWIDENDCDDELYYPVKGAEEG